MITVADLAKAKGFTIPFLKSLGVYEINDSVIIPYFKNSTRTEMARSRIRSAIRAKDGCSWSTGKEIVPYGLWRLDEARKHKYIIIVEGETDCWTLWSYGYCALGLPGAGTSSKILQNYLEGIETIYVWIEPDEGGKTLLNGMRKRMHEIKWHGALMKISVPNRKDPNEIHLLDKKEFKKIIRYAINGARRIEPFIPPVKKEIKYCGTEKLNKTMIDRAAQFPLEELVDTHRGFILCPLHEDHKPTMWVKNGYGYCFACGKSMNSIQYLMKSKNMHFRDAVNALGQLHTFRQNNGQD